MKRVRRDNTGVTAWKLYSGSWCISQWLWIYRNEALLVCTVLGSTHIARHKSNKDLFTGTGWSIKGSTQYSSCRCADTRPCTYRHNRAQISCLAQLCSSKSREQHAPLPRLPASSMWTITNFSLPSPWLAQSIFSEAPCVYAASPWSWSSTSQRSRGAEHSAGGELISLVDKPRLPLQGLITLHCHTLSQGMRYTHTLRIAYEQVWLSI